MRVSRPLLAVVAAAATLSLAACAGAADGNDPAGGGDAAGDGTFPVTITHAFGETVIESQPERVASVAWGNHEAALALGVVPVIMEAATWGDDDGDGVLPWVEDTIAEMGVETPPTYDPTSGIDFEAVADSDPDIILAAYSGLTQEDYDTLTQIAPVVAYPDVAWATTWQEMTIINGTALGLKTEAEELVASLEQTVTDTAAENPNLAGKGVAFSYIDPTDLSVFGFYTLADPRAAFLPEIGMATPAVVEEASAGGEFWATVSSEAVDTLSDVDVLITYGDDTTLATAQADPLYSRIPAVANGAVAILTDGTPLAASANPSPLSIPVMLSDYMALIDDAAANAP